MTFYVSITLVLFIRIVLFTDVFMHYNTDFYVIVLITMPTFLYLITGISLVLQNFELMMIFKNISTMQSNIKPPEKLRLVQRNKRAMKAA